ncbi:MAG: peptidoglycan DD-metalloendopeptidase family protein [Clostridiales bacterium]|nr:peptidoglycan DD-metalloendopeptidase family protein [Clostridiales bacterium]
MKKRMVVLVVVISLLLSTFQVYGYGMNPDDINKLQKDKDEINKKIELTKSQKTQKEKEKRTLSNQIEELEKKICASEKELEEVEELLSDLEGKVAVTQREYDRAVTDAEKQRELLNKRVRVMYQNGTVGYLSVLLNSKSFSNFISRMDLLRKIINYDVNVLKERKTYRDLIDEKKIQLEAERQETERLKEVICAKKDEVESTQEIKKETLKKVFKDLVELEKLEDKLLEESAELTKKILALQSNDKYVGGDMAWPAPGYTGISSYFGYRLHPILKKNKLHTGIDIKVTLGKNIVAANDGKVIFSGTYGGYGKAVIIDHGGKTSTLYAHNSKLLIKEGDVVVRGQTVSLCGSTGLSTGPHLHFEVRINGSPVDPLPYVTKKK